VTVSSFSEEERARECILDIIDYAERIAVYIKGRSYDDFTSDTMFRDAVERCLLVITEAAIRLGPEHMAAIAPETPLHVLRGLGNALRHAYHKLHVPLIWRTATIDVPDLADACRRALARGAA
jgi:uncharacterized protein with HEPN domain